MSLQFFCAENRVNDWINYWKRQRLVWWRKFANVRSNFSLYEEQSNLEAGVDSQTFLQVWFRYYPFNYELIKYFKFDIKCSNK